MISAAVIEALKEIVPADKVLLQEPMKLHTTFRIGGPADCLVYLENEEQLCKIQKYLRLVDVPYTVIGNGSNLLVSDQGYAGIVLVIGKHMSRIEVKDCYLEAEAGALMSQVAKAAKEHGLTGLEIRSRSQPKWRNWQFAAEKNNLWNIPVPAVLSNVPRDISPGS